MDRNYRIFFRRSLSISFFSLFMIGMIFTGIRPDPKSFMEGSLIQLELLETIPSPRIILAGGSNLAFGVDASLMQEELGIPVINDGLHAGLGVWPLQEVQENIHEGDIIILSLEYDMFSNLNIMNGNPSFLADWIERSPARLNYLPDPITEALPIYTIIYQKKVNRTFENVLIADTSEVSVEIYNRGNSFDANGDFIGHLLPSPVPLGKITSNSYPVFPLKDEMFTFLREFREKAQEKGATIYFEAPASRETNCNKTGKDKILNFFKLIGERTSIPLLTRLEDVCIPDDFFYNTEYHLNAEGRELRTKRLIENLVQIYSELR